MTNIENPIDDFVCVPRSSVLSGFVSYGSPFLAGSETKAGIRQPSALLKLHVMAHDRSVNIL